jgi:hypothetical protein
MEAFKSLLCSYFGKPLKILKFLAENERATVFLKFFTALQTYERYDQNLEDIFSSP